MTRRIGCWVLAACLLGCGARTSLDPQNETDTDDAGPLAIPDAGPPPRRDAGPPPRRDAGPPPMQDAGPPGVDCAADADCSGGLVCRAQFGFTPVDVAPHPLQCGLRELGGRTGEPCVRSMDCSRRLCSLPGVCLKPCRRDADCDPNERCRPAWVRTANDAMQPFDACTAFVVAPATVTSVGAMPSVSVDPGSTTREALPAFDPNALIIWLGRPDTFPLIGAIRTVAMPPQLVYDGFSGSPTDPAPIWGVGTTTVGGDLTTLLYPNGAMTPMPPRGFEMELSSFSATRLERIVAQRTTPGAVFDVDIYLVGGDGLTSPDGRVPAEITRGINEARGILRPIGLDIGEVRVHEVVGDLRARLGAIDGPSSPLGFPAELSELWRLTAGANRPAVHVFYNRVIEGALGIASGIPGPHILPGTASSGVALAGDSIPTGMVGEVLAHEVGHFMGLFHTSEMDGDVNDPHPDTLECRQDRDRDRDGVLAPFECTGAGANNLMFWTGMGTAISPQQAEVMRRAYFVR